MGRKVLTGFFTLCVCLFFFMSLRAAGDRFVDNGDGTVTDTAAGLMWTKEDNMGDISWREAEVYCKNPPVAGYRYSDWRMPTVEELKGLYQEEMAGYETDCGLMVRIPPMVRLSCAWVWASEHKAIAAYAFNFSRGYRYSTLMLDKKHFRALAVRSVNKR